MSVLSGDLCIRKFACCYYDEDLKCRKSSIGVMKGFFFRVACRVRFSFLFFLERPENWPRKKWSSQQIFSFFFPLVSSAWVESEKKIFFCAHLTEKSVKRRLWKKFIPNCTCKCTWVDSVKTLLKPVKNSQIWLQPGLKSLLEAIFHLFDLNQPIFDSNWLLDLSTWIAFST